MSKPSSVAAGFERALEDILTRVCISGSSTSSPLQTPPERPLALAIAYSGGLDSSVLLHVSRQYAAQRGMRLFAFHIHHGISANADAWLAHCKNEAERLDVTFDARKVQLAGAGKCGVEEAARISRYAALGDLCRSHQVPLLLTAHHLDDQAETVLLQLLRGSGVAGLSGMDRANTAADLLGNGGLWMARPLLDCTRGELERYATNEAIAYIVDESNHDPRYARNALRHQVMPQLDAGFPGFQERLARTASHMQSAQRLLDELAQHDLVTCADGDCLDLQRLKELSRDRIDNLLRYWLGAGGIRMPSTSWLTEMRTQLLEAKADARLCVSHPDCDIRRYRNRVYVTPKWARDPASIAAVEFCWQGEDRLHFAEYGGSLHFEAAAQGIDPAWLRQQSLRLSYRQGGEKLKPAANRSTRSLKHHYQAMQVPAWEREFLPLVSTGGHLLYAAGIGMDCQHVEMVDKGGIMLRWLHEPIGSLSG